MTIVLGRDPEDLLTKGYLRPIFYLEGKKLHLFCPNIKTDGKWHWNINLWSNRKSGFLLRFDNDPRRDLCKSPLNGNKVNVAFSGFRDITTVKQKDGTLSGLDIELTHILAEIFNFTPVFFRKRQRNFWLSPNDLAVS